MSNIKLGECPKTFKPFPVKFEMPDGKQAAVKVTFHYRTREQFGEFQNEVFGASGGDEERLSDGGIDFKKLYEKLGARHAVHLTKAIESWDLDFPPTAENLKQMGNEIASSPGAFMAAYSGACTEGRLGN